MEERKQRIMAAFDLASPGYDHPVSRFFDVHALSLVRHAQIYQGARVLDVATGTGKVALEAARVVGSKGEVIGVDLSEGMLERARGKASALPVEFQQMDAERLEFDDATFDFALCGFAIFFMPNMVHCIREMHRVLCPGGRLVFSTWTTQAFEPMAEMTRACFERYGIPRFPPPPWMVCTEPWHLLTLLEKGSFSGATSRPRASGLFH